MPHDTNPDLDTGARVMTPIGPGTIVYRRYHEHAISAYSVCLDARKEASTKPPFPTYTGTLFPAHQVAPLDSSAT